MTRDQILELLRERIVRFAASKLTGGDFAQDIAQEVLLVLHEKYRAVEAAEELVPLALEIARYKMMGAWRKTVRRGENTQVSVDDLPLASSAPSPFEETARQEQIEQLESALAGLGDRCKEIIRMKLEGLTFQEIQERLKVASINTIYTWDFRCRRELLERMGGASEKKQ